MKTYLHPWDTTAEDSLLPVTRLLFLIHFLKARIINIFILIVTIYVKGINHQSIAKISLPHFSGT